MNTFDWRFGITEDRHKKTYKNISARGIICKQGKYLMLKTNRGDVVFPGGRIEAGESFEDACKREVLEETGYKVVGDLTYVGHCITRKEDRYDKEAIYEIEERYYSCQVGEEFTEPTYTTSELKWGYEPNWMTGDDIVKINKIYESHLGKSDPWIEKVNSIIGFC